VSIISAVCHLTALDFLNGFANREHDARIDEASVVVEKGNHALHGSKRKQLEHLLCLGLAVKEPAFPVCEVEIANADLLIVEHYPDR